MRAPWPPGRNRSPSTRSRSLSLRSACASGMNADRLQMMGRIVATLREKCGVRTAADLGGEDIPARFDAAIAHYSVSYRRGLNITLARLARVRRRWASSDRRRRCLASRTINPTSGVRLRCLPGTWKDWGDTSRRGSRPGRTIGSAAGLRVRAGQAGRGAVASRSGRGPGGARRREDPPHRPAPHGLSTSLRLRPGTAEARGYPQGIDPPHQVRMGLSRRRSDRPVGRRGQGNAHPGTPGSTEGRTECRHRTMVRGGVRKAHALSGRSFRTGRPTGLIPGRFRPRPSQDRPSSSTGPAGRCRWRGADQVKPSEGEERLVKALLDAFPGGLDSEAMRQASGGSKGWRTILDRLCERAPVVGSEILYPRDRPDDPTYGLHRARPGDSAYEPLVCVKFVLNERSCVPDCPAFQWLGVVCGSSMAAHKKTA